ncbi:bacillithiol system redox-active protein YtxJ [Bacillus swezeyi]|uniref:Bacillithiol system redox-active protein YtxJ n=1 Tax=Bacillus swezeyi TaxID=1925020 RepID=A0A5M8RM40_9BACI|nr:bacillithiol system redox-active protein YtxJ [Bacillus swezeyi]KAA6448568.1 bacillithiol system redox-active protein YtxJ [Bacillus swezeyi]KAA6481684.1 bacillithiol system redox-active protein YtxJ [Bacillus swezeyi]TYS34879.1 bacillithiol system redox-active protein YtxJ [Bacillus swezeyi]
MSKQLIQTEDEFKRLVEQNDTFIFLKHSITCPISRRAFDEFEAFANQHEDYPTYYLQVQDSRPLSNYIADHYGIKHESPQAIIFTNGKVKWHASHSQITAQALAENSK